MAGGKTYGRFLFPSGESAVVALEKESYVAGVQRLVAAIFIVLAFRHAQTAPKSSPLPPSNDALPGLAASFTSRLEERSLRAPDGNDVAVGTVLDAVRVETCLRTITQGGGWPASWLIVSDSTKPYDLVVRVVLVENGTIADPETIFLATRRDWDDAAFNAAFQAATGKKPPREKQRNLVIQSFTKKTVTDYVYDLPPTGHGAKGLLALLPEGSLIREAPVVDLGDGKHHTLAIALIRPRFVPADCATNQGRQAGHRDSGGVLLALAGESALEDTLDITEIVRMATGATLIPRFACMPGDVDPGAIDALVDSKFEGREPVRLLDLSGRRAESEIAGLPVVVGIKRANGVLKLFASVR